jgi:hypothetical protein
MCFDGCLVLLNPVSIACVDNEFGTLLLQNFDLFFSPDDVQQWYFLSLTQFVNHSSQSWGCSWVDDSFACGSLVAPFSVSFNQSNRTDRIYDSWGCWFDWNVFSNWPDVFNVSNWVLSPSSKTRVKRDFFADEMFTLRTSSLDDLTKTLEAANKIGFSSPLAPVDHDSVWRVDGRSDHLDLDLVEARLWEVKIIVDRRFLEFLDNKSFLLLFCCVAAHHWLY